MYAVSSTASVTSTATVSPSFLGRANYARRPKRRATTRATGEIRRCHGRTHAVTQHYTFPFGDLGYLHGEGFGDVNGDGKPDLLERGGALDRRAGASSVVPCPAPDCGWVKQNFYDGLLDNAEQRPLANLRDRYRRRW